MAIGGGGPFDYSLPNMPAPGAAFMSGVTNAATLDDLRMKKQMEQAQMARQAQMQKDLATLYTAPTVENIQKTMAAYPEYADKWKPLLESATTEKKTNLLSGINNILMPIAKGDRTTALEQIKLQREAAQNSGNIASANSLDMMQKLIENTDTGKAGDNLLIGSLGSAANAIGGPEYFKNTYGELLNQRREEDLAPTKLSEAQSKAQEAAVKAKFTESNAVQDLVKKGWDITKIQSDIQVAKQNAQIAAANLAISRQTNDLKKRELQLKVDEMSQKRDEVVRTKSADLESARFNMDNMVNTLNRIQNTPPKVIWDATGPIRSKMPTVDANVSDFEELVGTVKAQAFLSQVPQMAGKGSLSDAEGKKLGDALQNLDLRQSPRRLLENVREATRLILKARENMAKKYGLPETLPDTPASTQKPIVVDF
jgi:hypothetical protein